MNKDLNINNLKEGDYVEVIDKFSMYYGEVGLVVTAMPFRVEVKIDNHIVQISYKYDHVVKVSSKKISLRKLENCYV